MDQITDNEHGLVICEIGYAIYYVISDKVGKPNVAATHVALAP